MLTLRPPAITDASGYGSLYRIIDLDPAYHATWFACLEDSTGVHREPGQHRSRWFDDYRNKGLRVKLAVDDQDRAIGIVQYLPVWQASPDARDLFAILLLRVQGYQAGVGRCQGKGIGTSLLAAAEVDARMHGSNAMATWGLRWPFRMAASWFRSRGYTELENRGMRQLLCKALTDNAALPYDLISRFTPAPDLHGSHVDNYLHMPAPGSLSEVRD